MSGFDVGLVVGVVVAAGLVWPVFVLIVWWRSRR